jgi:hypothetical protein
MCLRRAPEKYITGAALDRAGAKYTLMLKCVGMFFIKLSRFHIYRSEVVTWGDAVTSKLTEATFAKHKILVNTDRAGRFIS